MHLKGLIICNVPIPSEDTVFMLDQLSKVHKYQKSVRGQELQALMTNVFSELT